MTHSPRRAVALSAIVLTVAGSVSACSEPDPTEDIAAAAGRVAAALESGETTGLWDDAVDLGAAMTNLTDLPRTVSVGAIGEPHETADGGPRAADVTFAWAWDLDQDGTEDWSYETTALVAEDDDGAWTVPYDPALIAEELGAGDELRLTRTPAARGDVLAGDGTAVVTDRPVLRVGVDKTRLPEGATEDQLREAATEVGRLAGLTDPAAYADRVVAAGPKAFVEAIVVREGSAVVDLTALAQVPGGVALPDEIPLAPTATWARALLGRVGEATAEIVEESGGAVAGRDLVGLSGLQQAYDERLRGTPGLTVTAGTGDAARPVFERPATDGADLELTLDPGTQDAAEAALAGTEGLAGLVAIRPSTGEVLAAANGQGNAGYDAAMLATLAPGSTFKAVTALALLRGGVGPEDTVSCTPEVSVAGYRIGNDPGYPAAYLGDITMTQAITHSCNTALINARDRLAPGALAEAGASLGLGQTLDGSWPAFTGSVPTDGTETEMAAALIGQGQVLASPLAMATVAASVAAGATVTPTLVLGPADLDAGAGATAPADVVAPPLTAQEAAVLAGYLRAVVTDGTGIGLADVAGGPVHAKTGSAEAGEGADTRVDSWMIAYRGDVAVAVLVQGGGYGSGAAGAAVEAFLRAIG